MKMLKHDVRRFRAQLPAGPASRFRRLSAALAAPAIVSLAVICAAPANGSVAAAGGVHIKHVKQQCTVVRRAGKKVTVDRVTVTAVSGRPGVRAVLDFAYNLNSADGTYQGPAKRFAVRHFTKPKGKTSAWFSLAKTAWPIMGLSVEATWSDGAAPSIDLTYVKVAHCWK